MKRTRSIEARIGFGLAVVALALGAAACGSSSASNETPTQRMDQLAKDVFDHVVADKNEGGHSFSEHSPSGGVTEVLEVHDETDIKGRYYEIDLTVKSGEPLSFAKFLGYTITSKIDTTDKNGKPTSIGIEQVIVGGNDANGWDVLYDHLGFVSPGTYNTKTSPLSNAEAVAGHAEDLYHNAIQGAPIAGNVNVP